MTTVWNSLSLLLAQAQEGQPPARQPGFDIIPVLVMVLPLVVLWYVLITMPQNKERARRQDMLRSLKKNDPVVTIGGIIGTIVNVTEDGEEVTIRADDNVRLRMRRDAIREVVVKDKSDTK